MANEFWRAANRENKEKKLKSMIRISIVLIFGSFIGWYAHANIDSGIDYPYAFLDCHDDYVNLAEQCHEDISKMDECLNNNLAFETKLNETREALRSCESR